MDEYIIETAFKTVIKGEKKSIEWVRGRETAEKDRERKTEKIMIKERQITKKN